MLTLLPVVILLLISLGVFLLRRLQRGTGYSWLVGMVLTFAVWAGLLALKWIDLPAFSAVPWRPFDQQNADQIIFNWDEPAWVFGFALISLVLCLLFTAPARLQHNSNPVTWAINLGITASGLLAVLAATPMATVLAWTLLDIVEIFLRIRLLEDKEHSNQAVIALSAKVAGTLVLLWAMAQSQASGVPLTYANIGEPLGVYLLIAAGLRLGVLPLNIPYVSLQPLQRGLSTTMSMVIQASSLVILVRMAPTSVPVIWINILLPITTLSVLYASTMWVTAKNDQDGRRYWSLAVAGLSVASILQGNQMSALVWGFVLIVSGGLLFFYSVRSKALTVLPALGLIALIGLPYTPSAAGMAGIAHAPYQFWDFLLIFSLGLLIAGYARLGLQAGDTPRELDRWILGVYPVGLVLLAISSWIIPILGITGGFNPGVWWVSVVALVLAGAIFWILLASNQTFAEVGGPMARSVEIVRRVASVLSNVFRLGWFYRFLWSLFNLVQSLLELTTRVLEGNGGVLWAILLIALLLTILTGGGFLG